MRHPSESVSEDKKGKKYLCIERKVVHSVMKARLQHSFDGHRARDTSIFLHIFSLQHFNFLLLSDPMFPFSIFISLFSNRSSSRNFANVFRKFQHFLKYRLEDLFEKSDMKIENGNMGLKVAKS